MEHTLRYRLCGGEEVDVGPSEYAVLCRRVGCDVRAKAHNGRAMTGQSGSLNISGGSGDTESNGRYSRCVGG